MAANYLGNYISRFSYGNRIAYSYILLTYKIYIMKRGTAYARSRKSDGRENSRRSKNSGASESKLYIKKLRLLFFRGELIRHRPLGSACSLPEQYPIVKVVNLYNYSVYIVRKSRTHSTYALYMSDYIII